MIANLATCEWHPGSNRSTVDPVVAVARLEMPEATRAVLVEKMKSHSFDDVVRITWAGIESVSGANSYDGAISNMNFGTGRICKAVTRNAWSIKHVENAIVYIVGDQAFGFAAVCGNLFRLTRFDKPAAQPVELAESVRLPDAALAESDVQLLGLPSGSGDVVSPDSAPITATGVSSATLAYFAPVFFAAPFITSQFFIAASVPEPATYLQLFAGLMAVVLWRRRS